MVFTVLGILFIMLFGVEIAYQEFFPTQEPELDGHPVRINNSEIIPMVIIMILFTKDIQIRIIYLSYFFFILFIIYLFFRLSH